MGLGTIYKCYERRILFIRFVGIMKKSLFTLFFFFCIMTGVISAGCLHETRGPSAVISEQNATQTTVIATIQERDFNATAVKIALQNETVRLYLSQGFTVTNVGPATTGINDRTLEVTAVLIDTPQDMLGVNVDVSDGSIVSIWTLPKRSPESH